MTRWLIRVLSALLLAALLVLPSVGAAAAVGDPDGPASTAEFRYLAAIYTSDHPGGNPACGGARVTPDWVLTAFHCVDERGEVKVAVGGVDSSDHNEQPIVGRPIQYGNTDVALVRTSNTSPVNSLLDYSLAPIVASNRSLKFAGWGYTNNSNSPLQPLIAQYAELSYMASCNTGYVCAADPARGNHKGPCDFDSGGPLIDATTATHRLVGIAKSGPQSCGAAYDQSQFTEITPAMRAWILNMTSCGGKPVTINLNATPTASATSGADVIVGTKGSDAISAGAGNDTVCGLGGADTIHGNGGDDTLHGNGGDDRLYGGDGADRMYGYAGHDLIEGGDGDDRLHGNYGNDTIRGGSGNDRIFGYGDHDTLDGGAGHDVISGNLGDDTIRGGAGNDKLYGSDGTDTVEGGPGNDRVEGNSGNDALIGGAGSDALDGGTGTDTCHGNSGRDTATRCETAQSIP